MAPFFEHVMPEWEAVLATEGALADLAVASLRLAARWLRADAALARASDLPGAPASLEAIAAAAGVEALLTLPESADRDRAALPGADVRVLRFADPRPPPAAGTGLLDLLMHHGPAAADVLRRGVG